MTSNNSSVLHVLAPAAKKLRSIRNRRPAGRRSLKIDLDLPLKVEVLEALGELTWLEDLEEVELGVLETPADVERLLFRASTLRPLGTRLVLVASEEALAAGRAQLRAALPQMRLHPQPPKRTYHGSSWG